MRIVLKKGKQRELISLAKSNYTWSKLSKELDCSSNYLRNELLNEKRFLSEQIYIRLCKIINKNSDNFIVERLNDNWGQIKGAKLSSGNIKKFIVPKESTDLAEFFGIILGDGHVEQIKIGKKIRCYSVTIAGDSRDDRDYLEIYVSNLLNRIFGEKGKISYSKWSNSLFLKIHGRKIVEFILSKGIKSGNKKINNQGIPKWILNNPNYLKKCLRGLIDTDGSVHYISKNNKNIRISFVSYINKLLEDVRQSFIKLWFNPSKIMRGRQIFLSSKRDVTLYCDIIGFSNQKHLKRLEILKQNAPVV